MDKIIIPFVVCISLLCAPVYAETCRLKKGACYAGSIKELNEIMNAVIGKKYSRYNDLLVTGQAFVAFNGMYIMPVGRRGDYVSFVPDFKAAGVPIPSGFSGSTQYALIYDVVCD